MTEVRWLRDQYVASRQASDVHGPDPVDAPVDEHGDGPLAWAREQADRPYEWSGHEPYGVSGGLMWMDQAKWDAAAEHSVRESVLSDDERAAWAEIVAHWVKGS